VAVIVNDRLFRRRAVVKLAGNAVRQQEVFVAEFHKSDGHRIESAVHDEFNLGLNVGQQFQWFVRVTGYCQRFCGDCKKSLQTASSRQRKRDGIAAVPRIISVPDYTV
jgi:hypothetical protein